MGTIRCTSRDDAINPYDASATLFDFLLQHLEHRVLVELLGEVQRHDIKAWG